MVNPKKIILILSVLFIFTFLLGNFSFAQEGKPLEVEYPEVEGIKPEFTTIGLPNYVKYIFNFSLMIAGLVAFGALIYGGVRHLTSAGDPTTMKDANDQIFAGILGLIILLSSYLILTTINPQLIILREPGLKEAPKVEERLGVKLCSDKILVDGKPKCVVYSNYAANLGEFDNKVTSVSFNNAKDWEYGVVLHENQSLMGGCAVCLSGDCKNEIAKIGGNGVSSITVFVKGKASSGGVTLYETKEYNKYCGTDCYQNCPQSGGRCGSGCVWGFIPPNPFPQHIGGKCWGPFTTTQPGFNSGDKVRSIEINGKYLAALSKDAGKCKVFADSDSDLLNNYLNGDVIRSLEVIPIK